MNDFESQIEELLSDLSNTRYGSRIRSDIWGVIRLMIDRYQYTENRGDTLDPIRYLRYVVGVTANNNYGEFVSACYSPLKYSMEEVATKRNKIANLKNSLSFATIKNVETGVTVKYTTTLP